MALRRRDRANGHDLFAGFGEVAEIGVGSLAMVYRARELDTGRAVALKLLNVRDASPRAIESFERESIALGSLSSHPNIVTLFRTFRTPDGRPVLVLELCSGAIADRLHDGNGLRVPDAVSIGIKVAGALETAHRGGILHRDVKPQNILMTEFGEPALADFGVAMLQSSTQTTAGLFDFTTLHAAPELLEGGGTSAATDVYELASSLYQLIAGQSAFRAYDGESPASVILRILRDPVHPLMGAGVPVQLSDLLIRAMSKDKDNRPSTAAEFASELADVEITQGWPRTQFLIRGPAQSTAGWVPQIIRIPDAMDRRRPPVPEDAAPVPPSGWTPATLSAVSAPAEPVAPTPTSPAAATDDSDWTPPTLAGPQEVGWTPPTLVAPSGGPRHAAAHEPEPPSVPEPEPPVVPQPEPEIIPEPEPIPAPEPLPIPEPTPAPTPEPKPAPTPEPEPSPEPAPTPPPEPTPIPPPEPEPNPLPTPTPEPSPRPEPPPLPQPEPMPDPFRPVGRVEPKPEPEPEVAAEPDTEPAIAALPDVPLWEPVSPVAEHVEPVQDSVRYRVDIDDDRAMPFEMPMSPPSPPVAPIATVPAAQLTPPAPDPEPASVMTGSWWSPVPGVERNDAAPSIEQYPVPPAAPDVPSAPDASAGPDPTVPRWAVRGPTPQYAPSAPQFVGDIAIDPHSLRPKLTVRAGLSSMTVDDSNLVLRSVLRRERLPWLDVTAFEPHFPDGDTGATAKGVLVALTPAGAIELPATRRLAGELKHVHALLDAYRVRAQMLATR